MRLICLLLLCASGSAFAQTAFLGSWPHQVLVFDTAQEKIVGKIDLPTDVPRSLLLSPDKKKLFVSSLNDNAIVTIDVATRQVLSSFSLNTSTINYRLNGLAADSDGRHLYTVATPIVKKVDRYEVESPKILVIDLQDKKISRIGDFPKEENAMFGYRTSLRVSPDGKLLYLFRNNVLVVDLATFKVAKKIDLEKPEIIGMENLSLNMVEDPNEADGMMTAVFNSSDPYVHRQTFGIAHLDLAKQTFNFTPVGPANTQIMSLLMTPDRKTGYTVAINGTHGNRRCEFWAFDMASRKLINKGEFDGRTRFFFGMSADGKKLLVYGAGYQIAVFDSSNFRLRHEIDVPGDITTNMVVLPVPSAIASVR